MAHRDHDLPKWGQSMDKISHIADMLADLEPPGPAQTSAIVSTNGKFLRACDTKPFVRPGYRRVQQFRLTISADHALTFADK
jgi:hypothetical protein